MTPQGSGGEDSSSSSRPAADERGRYRIRPEWIRSDTVRNAALIVVGIYMVQSLLAISSVDLPAQIALVAWAIAIPLLAAHGMLNVTHESYRYASFPFYMIIVRIVAPIAALVGMVAAFWHVWMPAGIAFIVSGVVAFAAYSAYSRRLDRDNPRPARQEESEHP
jgi:hypothetical protein